MFGVFRVKNHDFTPKNHTQFFFKFRGGAPGSAPVYIKYKLPVIDWLPSNDHLSSIYFVIHQKNKYFKKSSKKIPAAKDFKSILLSILSLFLFY